MNSNLCLSFRETVPLNWKFFTLLIDLIDSALEKIVREQRVLYGKHMDITSYDGKRETHNPAGRGYLP